MSGNADYVLPVDLIVGVRSASTPKSQPDSPKQTVEQFQLVFKMASPNLKTSEGIGSRSITGLLSFPSYTYGEAVSVHRQPMRRMVPTPKSATLAREIVICARDRSPMYASIYGSPCAVSLTQLPALKPALGRTSCITGLLATATFRSIVPCKQETT